MQCLKCTGQEKKLHAHAAPGDEAELHHRHTECIADTRQMSSMVTQGKKMSMYMAYAPLPV